MKFISLENQKFGRLTVIRRGPNRVKKVAWECLCDCGNTTLVTSYNLKSGKISSCGCLKRELLTNKNIKHNQRHTKLYEIWKAIKQRCNNPNNIGYKNYGGRGITICEEWQNNFESFYEWSINNGYTEQLSIDRIDVNGNYEPNNCRWATRLEQANNTRNTKYYTYDNKTLPLRYWCNIYNMNYKQIYDVLRRGVPFEEIIKRYSKN